jgi:hypothetical protein
MVRTTPDAESPALRNGLIIVSRFDPSNDTSDKARFGKAFYLSIDYDSFLTPQDEDHIFTQDASVNHILQEMTMEEIFGYIPSKTTFDTYVYALRAMHGDQ